MTNPRRPALTILAVILVMAGASRIGLGVARVVAAETESPTAPGPSETSSLLAALQAREERLRAGEAALAERQSALAAAEADIRRQLDTLAQAEEQLKQTLSLTETAAEADVARLVSAYESMKPKQAADLFSQMDVTFAAGFFGRFRPEFAGAVLAEMDPTIAYAISAVLAGRHARTPRN
jgi:flagellar motility protein MotE (MotC chaperone)